MFVYPNDRPCTCLWNKNEVQSLFLNFFSENSIQYHFFPLFSNLENTICLTEGKWHLKLWSVPVMSHTILTDFWKSHMRSASLIPFPLYFFETELFYQSLDGGICVLLRDISIFERGCFYCCKACLCVGGGRVPKFMFDSVGPHNKEGSSVCLCSHEMFESLDDRGDCPANTVL